MNQEAIEPQDELEEVLNEAVEVEEPEAATPEEEGKAEDAQPEERKRNRVPAHRRINQYRRKLGDEERKNEALRKENEELRGSAPKPKENVRPNEDNFSTHAEFIAALDGYHETDKKTFVDKEIAKRDAKRKQEDEEYNIQEAKRKGAEAWAKQTASAHKADPKYKDKELDLIAAIEDLNAYNLFDDIFDCDNGAKIVTSLSEDYSELKRIAKLSPRRAAIAIDKLDEEFNKRKKRDEPLPPPTRDRNSGRSVQRASGKPKETQKEYNIRMNGL